MELLIPWNNITRNNGKPSFFRIVFYQTNGNSSNIFAYGESPAGNTDGNVPSAAISNWWGGYSVSSGVSPNNSSDQALPVTLNSFSAIPGNKLISLKWTTQSEIQNDAFIIEKKTDGTAFEKIAEVPGLGSSPTGKTYTYTDYDVENGTTYYYRLADRDYNGKVTYHQTISATPFASGGISREGNLTPTQFKLLGNYPNPFNPTTTIVFDIPKSNVPDKLTLEIYNMLGQKMTTLYNGTLAAGRYNLEWNGTNQNGTLLPTGVYIAVLQNGNQTDARKLILMK
jgi:hypothetical protein